MYVGDDACDTNPTPPNVIFRHSSMMISMNTGDPAQSKIPCTYWLSTKNQNTGDRSATLATTPIFVRSDMQSYWHTYDAFDVWK